MWIGRGPKNTPSHHIIKEKPTQFHETDKTRVKYWTSKLNSSMHQLKITNMPPGRGQLTGFYSIYLGVSFLYYTKPTTLSSSLLNSYRGSYDVELMISHRIVLHNQIWGTLIGSCPLQPLAALKPSLSCDSFSPRCHAILSNFKTKNPQYN